MRRWGERAFLEDRIQRPATARVFFPVAAVVEEIPVLAAGVFEGVRQDRHLVETPFIINRLGDSLDRVVAPDPPIGQNGRVKEEITKYVTDQVAPLHERAGRPIRVKTPLKLRRQLPSRREQYCFRGPQLGLARPPLARNHCRRASEGVRIRPEDSPPVRFKSLPLDLPVGIRFSKRYFRPPSSLGAEQQRASQQAELAVAAAAGQTLKQAVVGAGLPILQGERGRIEQIQLR